MAANAQPHLADLHAQAAQAGIEGYRKLTRAELMEALELEPGEV